MCVLTTTAYSIEIPNPVFNEEFKYTTSNIVKEKSLNEFSGEILNSILFENGELENPEFTGMCAYPKMVTTNSGFSYDINKTLMNSDSISVSFWVNRINTEGHWATLLEMTDENNERVMSITTESTYAQVENSGFSFYVRNKNNGTHRRFIDNSIAINLNKWTHLSLTYSESNGVLALYLNGLPYKEVDMEKGGMNYIVKKLYIGRSANGESGLHGSMDEVKIFSSTLTPEQIKSIYINEKNMMNYSGVKRECQTKECSLKLIEQSSPISDMFGKNVFTQKTFIYDCVYVVNTRGVCETEDSNITYEIPEANFTNAYIDTFAGGDLKEIATIASAQSYANKVMTGWKGYCIDGVDEDFSWASDPYFWSSIALSALSGSLADAASSANAAKDAAVSTALTESTSATADATINAAQEAFTQASKDQLLAKMGQYATCAAQAGMDLAKMESEPDEIPCDPVDQICEAEDMSYDDQTYTLSQTAYDDMLQTSPEYAKYIKITSQADGQVQFLIVYPSDTADLDDEALKKSLEEAKEKMERVKYLAIASFAASCLGDVYLSGTGGTNTTTGTDDDGISGADLAKGATNMIASAICGPLCGAATQILGELATSFKSVDTCDDKDDAAERGDRHSSTYEATRLGLCTQIKTDCVIDAKIGGGCQLRSKYYCCYDSVLTKVLAEQMKAQLGISWSHCTGISLNEFMHIGFSSCKDLSGTDGTNLPYDASVAQRHSAFQYKDKCIDYTDYISYISRTTNGRFNEDDIMDMMDTSTNASETCSE